MKTFNPRSRKKSRIRDLGVPAEGSGKRAVLSNDVVISLAIFALAFTIRLIYLFQVESVPLFYHLAADGRSYDEWAQRIAAGDWLGQEIFYQAPLYPYFLALFQAILGHDLWSIRVIQIILGSASCALLYWAGRSFLSRWVGIVAGLILSLYAPAIFFDALIQKTVLDLFLITLLLLLLGRAQQRPHWARWGGAGVVLGLLGLTRENTLLWLFIVPIWIGFHFTGERPGKRLGWVGVFLVGSVLVLLPVGLRNLTVGGEFILTTSQLGPNFFIGNNPRADGTYVPLRGGHGDPKFERVDATELAEQAVGRSLSPGEVSRYWLQRSLDYVRSQPLDWLLLMGRKWLILWNVHEFEDADDFYLYQRWSWLLTVLARATHFGVLAPLAAMGIVVTWRERWRLWLLYLLLASLALSVALFYIFGRYRFPMIPFLALFAGAGIVEVVLLWKERRLHQLLACAAIVLLTAVAVGWPAVSRPGPSAAGYNNLANALAKQDRFTEAEENYRQALEVDPNFEAAHFDLGNVFARQGKLDEAKEQYQETLKVAPDFAEAHNNLGNVLAAQGNLENAIQHFRQALRLGLTHSETHFNLGNALAKQGHLKEAIEHFREAVRIRSDFFDAYHHLGVVVAAQGDLDQAVEYFQQALRIQPEFTEAHESLAQALAQQGKRDEAMKHYQEALRIMQSRPESPPRR